MTMTWSKTLMMLSAILSFSFIQAQQISGTVSDASGPLPGASIVIKGSSTGAQTDFDGNYTLADVPEDATLVFSYIGYASLEIAVDGQTTINATLQEDAQALDEVVIIGYGSTTIKDATGSVSAVSSGDFNGGVISSPEQLIQGKVAGVNISSSSGAPGAGITLNIRGSNSIRSNNNPLYVVDGIPLSGEANLAGSSQADDGSNTGSTSNPLNFLNPEDIESMSILKDASATAIYGSRGANGVVIITTKTGKAGQGGIFEFGSTISVSQFVNGFDILGREDFLTGIQQVGGDRNIADFGADTDWLDVITRDVASQNQNLSYSNNYGNGNVRATFGYGKQFGVIENSALERITGRINLNHRFFDDKLILGVQASISRINDDTPPLSTTAGASGDLFAAALLANPTTPNDAGFFIAGGTLNPANILGTQDGQINTDRLLVNGSIEYKITPELSAKVNLGYDQSDSEATSLVNALNGANPGISQGIFNQLESTNKLLEVTANYAKEFDNSKLDIIVGYSFQDFSRSGLNSEARLFTSTDLNQMRTDIVETSDFLRNGIPGDFQQFAFDNNTGNDVQVGRLDTNAANPGDRFVTETISALAAGSPLGAYSGSLFETIDELQSFFGRVNYDIANTYLFTATLRADGSSRFGPENQYGYFPSGAFAWKLTETDFVGDNISTLKLRLGAGITGNQEGLGHAQFARRERFTNDVRFSNDGASANSISNGFPTSVVANANPELKWESTVNYNLGLDFGFNDDRFSGAIDVYQNTTRDQILGRPASAPSFGTNITINLPNGEIVNQGVELALNYDWVQNEDFDFSTSFNISYNSNEIKNLGDFTVDTGQIRGQGLSNAFAQRLADGQPLFSWYMSVFEGFDGDGFPIYSDTDGNGVGDPDADKIFVGEDALPDVTSGLSLNARYKNWDINAYLAGQFGFSIYNGTATAVLTRGNLLSQRNVDQIAFNSPVNPAASNAVSTRYLEKGDFVRLQNATIGYNVPVTGAGLFKSLRLSLTGQNLFLLTDYSGIDPEVSSNTGTLGSGVPSRGIDYLSFPRPRTFTLGLNARF